MFDPQDPPCMGRFGFGSGYHLPEFEEEQRAGLDADGFCLGCPVREECTAFSMTLAGIDVEAPCVPDTLQMIVNNWTAGRRARARASC